MDEEYSETEEGREEEERLEDLIERVDGGFGNVPIASPPYYVHGRTVIRVSFSPEFAPWHWKLARRIVDLCLGGFNRGLLPERFLQVDLWPFGMDLVGLMIWPYFRDS